MTRALTDRCEAWHRRWFLAQHGDDPDSLCEHEGDCGPINQTTEVEDQ